MKVFAIIACLVAFTAPSVVFAQEEFEPNHEVAYDEETVPVEAAELPPIDLNIVIPGQEDAEMAAARDEEEKFVDEEFLFRRNSDGEYEEQFSVEVEEPEQGEVVDEEEEDDEIFELLRGGPSNR